MDTKQSTKYLGDYLKQSTKYLVEYGFCLKYSF
jgi:hypothetical protein